MLYHSEVPHLDKGSGDHQPPADDADAMDDAADDGAHDDEAAGVELLARADSDSDYSPPRRDLSCRLADPHEPHRPESAFDHALSFCARSVMG